jgi:hypothetical protein
MNVKSADAVASVHAEKPLISADRRRLLLSTIERSARSFLSSASTMARPRVPDAALK